MSQDAQQKIAKIAGIAKIAKIGNPNPRPLKHGVNGVSGGDWKIAKIAGNAKIAKIERLKPNTFEAETRAKG